MGSQHKWGRYRLLTKYTHLQHSPVTKSITEDIYVNLDVLWSEGCVTRLLACLLLIRAAQELPILYLLLFLTLCRSVKPPTGAFLQTSKLKYQQSSCTATFGRHLKKKILKERKCLSVGSGALMDARSCWTFITTNQRRLLDSQGASLVADAT